MKQLTRFYVRQKDCIRLECISEVDMLVPNLNLDRPVMIKGIYYWVKLVETILTDDGYIMQHVLLKTNG